MAGDETWFHKRYRDDVRVKDTLHIEKASENIAR